MEQRNYFAVELTAGAQGPEQALARDLSPVGRSDAGDPLGRDRWRSPRERRQMRPTDRPAGVESMRGRSRVSSRPGRLASLQLRKLPGELIMGLG